MTTEEKLDRFKEICIEDARAQLEKVVNEYRSGLESTFSEHCEDARRRKAMRIGIEKEKIEREARKELSMDQIKLKRRVSARQQELKDKLFDEVCEKLSAYRSTDAYRELIENEIKEIRKLAGAHPYDIYLDQADVELVEKLGENVRLSNTAFLGGTIGVIPDKNIVVDNSFRTKLEAEKSQFSFEV